MCSLLNKIVERKVAPLSRDVSKSENTAGCRLGVCFPTNSTLSRATSARLSPEA